MSDNNLIMETWPVDHTFTVAFTVKEPGAAAAFTMAMRDENNLFHGCEIERVDVRDVTAEYEVKVAKLRAFLDETFGPDFTQQ